ncbi:peroxiredoxin-6-like [Rattus rattus]|uniref:peroxiredoxin-6-like n=1 Tax=Rattus rattus TaxID=10117 RepID=UPI0013F30FCF|nr:peroxiredoxin-6-like [Rattus rattus]
MERAHPSTARWLMLGQQDCLGVSGQKASLPRRGWLRITRDNPPKTHRLQSSDGRKRKEIYMRLPVLSSLTWTVGNRSRLPDDAKVLVQITLKETDTGLLTAAAAPPCSQRRHCHHAWNFEANTTISHIRFHDFLGDSWGILFSHPRDFTPVCTTELGRAAKLAPEFAKRNVKLIALSIDCVEDHFAWSKNNNAYNAAPTEKLPFPIIDDKDRDLAILLGILDPSEKDEKGMPLTARVVFIFGPDKKLKLSIFYPATTGRNFDEILRLVDSLQLTASNPVATPVDWKKGESVMVLPTLPEEEAKRLFLKESSPKSSHLGKKYLRYTHPSLKSLWELGLSLLAQHWDLRMIADSRGFLQFRRKIVAWSQRKSCRSLAILLAH